MPGAHVRGPRPASDDLGDVVVAAQEAALVEVEDLRWRVGVEAGPEVRGKPPPAPFAHVPGLELACAHFLAGEMGDAEESLTRALRVDERHVRAHLQMGVLRKVQGKTKEAIAHFDRVVELDTSGKKKGDAANEAGVHLTKLRV